MIGIFIFIAILLIILSFLVGKYPNILAGYKPNTSKKVISSIQKLFLITGLIYLPLGIFPLIINDSFILTIILIVPITAMVIFINRKSIQ